MRLVLGADLHSSQHYSSNAAGVVHDGVNVTRIVLVASARDWQKIAKYVAARRRLTQTCWGLMGAVA